MHEDTAPRAARFLTGLLIQLANAALLLASAAGLYWFCIRHVISGEGLSLQAILLGLLCCLAFVVAIVCLLRTRLDGRKVVQGVAINTTYTPLQNIVGGLIVVVCSLIVPPLFAMPDEISPASDAVVVFKMIGVFLGVVQAGLGLLMLNAIKVGEQEAVRQAQAGNLSANDAGELDAPRGDEDDADRPLEERLSPQQMEIVNEIRTALSPWIERHKRKAWRPIAEPGEGDAAASKYGGVPWLGEGEAWPACEVCGKPMTLFMQLNSEQTPKEIAGRFGPGLLQLYYCAGECETDRDAPWQAFSRGTLIRVVDPSKTAGPKSVTPPDCAFPEQVVREWVEFDDLPDPCEHENLGLDIDADDDERVMIECPAHDIKLGPLPPLGTDDDWWTAVEAVGFSGFGDKIGGWPAWVQRDEYSACPTCGARMEYLCQIESHQAVPHGFGDAGRGHLLQCPTHRDIFSFVWAGH